MKRSMIALALLAGAVPVCRAADEYRLDDGAVEQNFGLVGGGAGTRQIVWMNRFVIQPGAEIVTHISVAFGAVPNGSAATAFLWYDVNQDGNPDDAFVIAGVTDLVVNANPGSPVGFTSFDIPDTALIPGDVVYAGCLMEISPAEQPARLDIDGTDQGLVLYPPNAHSFIAGDTQSPINPNALAFAQLPITPVAAAFGFDGNWVVRMDASPILAPCPTDLDGDGFTSAADLAALLAAWNTGLVDFNGDGATTARDLAILLAAWGPCP